MSLINQVLKDLDQRRVPEIDEDTRLDDLYTSGVTKVSRRNKIYVAGSVIGLLIVAVVVSTTFWFSRTNDQQTINISATNTAKTQKPVTTVAQRKQTQVVVPVMVPGEAVKKSSVAKARVIKQPVSKPKGQSHADAHLVVASEHNVAKQMVPMRKEQRAELAYQSGYDYLGQRRYQKGEKQLRKALAIEATHVKSRELLAGLLIKQGRWVEASEVLRHGISVSPNYQPFVKLYARTLMQMSHDKKAIAILRQYSPSIQNDPDHYALLAALYQRQKDHLSASNTYAEILKIRPNMGIWWVGMGISLEAMRNHKQAQQAYNRARRSGVLHGDIARYTDNRLLALDEISFPLE